MNLAIIHKRFTVSTLLNGIFIVLVLTLFFNPSAKALLIRGLMEVGLFQPDVSKPIKTAGGTRLPNIRFQNVNGQILNLADQKGKVVFMNFWATWCSPCIAEMPAINDLYVMLKGNKNIIFIMVDVDHDFGKSLPFMTRHQYTLPLYEANSEMPKCLLGGSVPTTVIIDKSGQIVFRNEGVGDYSNTQVMLHLLKLSR